MRAWIVLATLLAACAPETEVAEDHAELLGAAVTRSKAGAVRVWLSGIPCSGSMLTEHWALTAAHCILSPSGVVVDGQIDIADDLGHPIVKYVGPVVPIKHLGYDPHHPALTARDDVGLVHLAGHGIDLTSIKRAQIWNDSRKPWASGAIQSAYQVGWGIGSPIGGATTCETGADEGILRMRLAPTFAAYWDDQLIATPLVHCDGDSGGPISYGLSSPEPRGLISLMSSTFYNEVDYGPVIYNHRSWIETTLRTQVPHAFTLTVTNPPVGGYTLRSFSESGTPIGNFNRSDGYCLTATCAAIGCPVTTAPCNGSSSQNWKLTAKGEIKIISSGHCLEVQGSPDQVGNRLGLDQCWGYPEQLFRVESSRIRISSTWDKCVDVPGGVHTGAQVQVYTCNYSPAQEFIF